MAVEIHNMSDKAHQPTSNNQQQSNKIESTPISNYQYGWRLVKSSNGLFNLQDKNGKYFGEEWFENINLKNAHVEYDGNIEVDAERNGEKLTREDCPKALFFHNLPKK